MKFINLLRFNWGFKMNELGVTRKKNKLFITLSWFMTFLALFACLNSKLPANEVIACILPMCILNLLITFFHFKRYFIMRTMYIAFIGSTIINLISLMIIPSTSNFFAAFYYVVMMAFFQKPTIVLLTGTCNLIGTNYMFFKFHESVFKYINNQTLVSIDICMIIVITFLIIQCIFSYILRLGLSKSNKNASSSQGKIGNILDGVRKII